MMATRHSLLARETARLRVPGRVQPRSRRCIRACCWLSEGGSIPTQWSQNLQHVYIRVTLPDEVKGRNIEVDIKRSYVSVQFNGASIVQGSLDDQHAIEPAGSFWEVEAGEDGSRELLLTLQKRSVAQDLMAYEPWRRLMESEGPDTTVTHRVFFDIQIGRKVFGRVVLGLYGRMAPRTAENFRALCTGELGEGRRGAPLHYKGSKILKIMPGFLIHGGDIVKNDGTGGDSIYGGPFPDENFVLRHDAPGKLAMANFGINSNLSQFHIVLAPVPFLDSKHVVFGEVVHGMPLIRLLERVGTVEGDRPEVPVVIADCGELTEEEFQAVLDASSAEGAEEAAALPSLPRPSSALTKMDIGGTDWR